MSKLDIQKRISVHCRTGSLEMARAGIILVFQVHCRTGSLESEDIDGSKVWEFTAVQAA